MKRDRVHGQARLERIELTNFRSFKSECVTLDNPTFLVGPNGAGKSNFANAISFLSKAMMSPLESALRPHGGFKGTAHRHGKGRHSAIGFDVTMHDLDSGVARATYALILRGRRDHNLDVALEHCQIEEHDGTAVQFTRREPRRVGDPSVRWRGEIDPPKLTRSTLALPLIGDERFSAVFGFLSAMRVYRIDPSVLRLDLDPYGDMELDEDGGNAARVLNRIKKHSPSDWEEICDLLAAAVPGIAAVQATKHRGELTLEFLLSPSNGGTQFHASDVSDGTLRALGTLIAAYQRPRPSLMVIEKPEASIHPGGMGVILDVLRGASRSSQAVVTTHSAEILDAKWIRDHHLRSVSLDDGTTRIDHMAPSVELAMSARLFGAGELIRSNALYGAERT